jgi:hypothetical protein
MSPDYQRRDAAQAVADATTNIRCVLVVDPEQPAWLTANTAAVLGVALGGHGLIPLGPGVADAQGEKHPGIGALPLPILAALAEKLPELRRKAQDVGLVVVDFNAAAHGSRTYASTSTSCPSKNRATSTARPPRSTLSLES